MLQTLKLLLPVLVPSWRFFDGVAPSPRIEYQLLDDNGRTLQNWQVFRPRPQILGLGVMVMRMFHNPWWNENLFLVSCAERMIAHPTRHSQQEIITRMRRDLARQNTTASHAQFRLTFIRRDESGALTQDILFTSDIFSCHGGGHK